MSMKQLTEVWISELQIFKWSKTLNSSQHLPGVKALVIKAWVKPSDFACASLVLLSSVRLAAVSISTNQSSNCIKSLPLKVGISWISLFAKKVCFWAVHKVSVCCCSTSLRNSSGADEQSARDNLWTSHSRQFMASIGWTSAVSTLSQMVYISCQGLQGGVVLRFHILKVIHVLMMVITWNISVLLMWGRVPLKGLSSASLASSNNVGLVCVNVGLARVS